MNNTDLANSNSNCLLLLFLFLLLLLLSSFESNTRVQSIFMTHTTTTDGNDNNQLIKKNSESLKRALVQRHALFLLWITLWRLELWLTKCRTIFGTSFGQLRGLRSMVLVQFFFLNENSFFRMNKIT